MRATLATPPKNEREWGYLREHEAQRARNRRAE